MLWAMDGAAIRAVLCRTPALNAGHLQALVSAAEGELARTLDPQVIGRTDLPPAARAYLTSPDAAECRADLDWLAAAGGQSLLYTDSGYPPLLARIPCPPVALFVLGDPAVLLTPQVAIVGSRNPTHGGCNTARELAGTLARGGLTITSGLAVGIDAAGHEAALLAPGLTVAVLGTGLDRVYPRRHAHLAARIREQGALVSEMPPRSRPTRWGFARRNRIISGLSLGTLVVEAALASGSLITARCAARQGRRVLAVPGSIRSPLARGCHQLIRDGARLVESAAQVSSELNFSLSGEALALGLAPVGARRELDNEYEMLLDALGFEPATVDSLAERTGRSCASVAAMLLILELEGRVAPQPGGTYGPLP